MRSRVHAVGQHVRTASLRAYLISVYPAADERLHQLSWDKLIELYESLDYYYSYSEFSRSSVSPMVQSCNGSCLARVPAIPYLPRGAYYHARGRAPLDKGRFNAILWGSFVRHAEPLRVLVNPLSPLASREFFSSFGARMGPQPSWTSPFAIVRYVHYPKGLRSPRNRSGRPRKAMTTSKDSFFWLTADSVSETFSALNASRAHHKRMHDATDRLQKLRDGDAVEIEQWGGLLGPDECPPVCGLWANIWKGTGVMLRVRRPFISRSKTTAIVEMIESLADRNATGLDVLIDDLGASVPVRMLQVRHRTAPRWACLCAHILAHVPCAAAPRDGEAAREAMAGLARRWSALIGQLSPEDVARVAKQLGSTSYLDATFSQSERFALYWALGVCGKGQRASPFWSGSPVGPDGLITALACVLDHKTIILTASPNDNGLLHQELVDYELPEPLGWPSSTGGPDTNDVRRCLLEPFAFVAADQRRGVRAKELRRQQMHTFWKASAKFVLPTDPGAASSSQVFAPCNLGFGHDGGPGRVAQCTGPKVRTQPTALKACWAWCNGTASQAVLATASLAHVRRNIGTGFMRGVLR